MQKKIKAVIFDLDGTLLDSMWIWDKVDTEYFNMKGLSIPENLKDEINHLSFEQTAYYFKTKFNISESIEEILNTWYEMAYKHYSNDISLKEGALDLLKFLKSRNIKIALATSNSKKLSSAALNCVKVYDYFDIISTTDEVENGKNCPDIYLLTSKRLGVSPEECLVFEDILEAVKGAKLANMKVFAVHDKYAEYQKEDLIKTADEYIYDFNDIKIKNLFL